MAYIAHENLADLFTLSSPDSFETTLPLSNLQDRRLGKVARRTSTGGTMDLRVDLGTSPPAATMFALLNYNGLSLPWHSTALGGISYTWTASNTAFNTPPFIASGSDTLLDRTYDVMPKNLFVRFGSRVTARYWQFSFGWAWDAIGVQQAGRLWFGEALHFNETDANVTTLGVDRGWSQGIRDSSVVRRSRGQSVYADEKPRYRTLAVTLTQQSMHHVFGGDGVGGGSGGEFRSLQEVLMVAGRSREVIVCPREFDDAFGGQFMNRTVIYGTIASDINIQQQDGDLFQYSFTVEESR